MLTQIMYEIFTDDIWKEWDSIYPTLSEYHKTWFSKNNLPGWLTILGDPRSTPRESTFMMESLRAFGVHHIEKYNDKKDKPASYTPKDADLMVWWWLNACETWRHAFWNFKVFLGRWVPEPTGLDVKTIKQIIQSAAMMDILTFNRFAPRNHTLDDKWALVHNYEGQNPEFTPAERIGCIAARKFSWITPDQTLFDELFTRISIIYGYTDIKLVRTQLSDITKSLCPYHHDDSQ